MKLLQKQINHKYLELVLYAVVFAICLFRPINLFVDSGGYLNMDIFRSPTYPLFLNILKTISGAYFNTVLIGVQSFIGILGIAFFSKTIKEELKLGLGWHLLFTGLLCLPYVYNHHVANNILSEALAYPLYLVVLGFFTKAFLKESLNPLLLSLLPLYVLLLTRSQFFFIVPLAILLFTYIVYRKQILKKNLGVLALLLVFPVIVSFSDKLYHKIAHEHFVNTPWTGIHIISPGMYVSDLEDENLFEDPKEKEFFKAVFNSLKEKHLNIHYLPNDLNGNTNYYISNFPKIANETVFEVGRTLLPNENLNQYSSTQYIAVDSITKSMTLPLVLDNFTEWTKLYFKNFMHAFESSKIGLLYVIVFLTSLFYFIKGYRGAENKTVLLICCFLFLNIALVSLGMHTIKRFIFYNDWVIFLICIILLRQFYLKTSTNGH